MYLLSSIATNIPIIASIGAIGIIVFLLLIARPTWAFCVLFLSLVIGQLVRIPFAGQGGGVLVSDIALVILMSSTLLAMLFGRISIQSTLRPFKTYFVVIFPFFVYSLALLLFHEQSLGIHSWSIALLYWVRLFVISLIFPITLLFSRIELGKKFLQRGFVATYYTLILLGYAQLLIFPSLVGNSNGWDPHIHRMIATWFDPNFFGAFIVLCMIPVVYWSRFKIPVFLVSFGALLLTASRSSWIAFLIAFLVISFFFLLTASLSSIWKKAAVILLIGCVLCATLVAGAFSDRVAKLFIHDPTATLRASAYKEAWHRLVEPNILFGVGYNAYQFSAKEVGLIQDFSIHSRAGSDNSIITLLVTTGIIGTLLFLIPILLGFYWHSGKWILSQRKESLIYIWAATALLVHAQFENSLLYPHLLIPFLIIAALSSI